MNPPSQHAKLYILGAVLLVGALLLSACGRFPPPNRRPPAEPCVVRQATPQPLAQVAPFVVDSAASPDYCQPEQVVADYLTAMDWYLVQAQHIAETGQYPPTMLEELGQYYTGRLLHETREALYYNQQAERAVFATWDDMQTIEGPIWDETGRTATIVVEVTGYTFGSLPEPAAKPVAPFQGGAFERWRVRLVYDMQAERWKIEASERLETS